MSIQIKNDIFRTWNLVKAMLHRQIVYVTKLIMKKLCKFIAAILLTLTLICTRFFKQCNAFKG